MQVATSLLLLLLLLLLRLRLRLRPRSLLLLLLRPLLQFMRQLLLVVLPMLWIATTGPRCRSATRSSRGSS